MPKLGGSGYRFRRKPRTPLWIRLGLNIASNPWKKLFPVYCCGRLNFELFMHSGIVEHPLLFAIYPTKLCSSVEDISEAYNW